MIRTLIVDDEPLARQGLRHLLETMPAVEIVGECQDGVEAIAAVREHQPDLLMLDIQMPEVTGFDVIDRLGKEHNIPAVIFVTAFDEFAVKAFGAHAFDYVLKPIDPDRLSDAIRRVTSYLALRESGDLARRLTALLRDFREKKPYLARIMVKSRGKMTFLETDVVDWIEANGDYVTVHTGDKKYLVRARISDLEKKLHPNHFARIHRSSIVRLGRIREIQPLSSGEHEVVLTTGKHLILSRTYRDRLFHLLSRSE